MSAKNEMSTVVPNAERISGQRWNSASHLNGANASSIGKPPIFFERGHRAVREHVGEGRVYLGGQLGVGLLVAMPYSCGANCASSSMVESSR